MKSGNDRRKMDAHMNNTNNKNEQEKYRYTFLSFYYYFERFHPKLKHFMF